MLAAALRALGRDSVLAVLCRGLMMPEAEVCEAEALLKEMGADYRILDVDVLAIPEFAANDKRRCYFCKKHLMSRIQKCAQKMDFRQWRTEKTRTMRGCIVRERRQRRDWHCLAAFCVRFYKSRHPCMRKGVGDRHLE